MTDRSSRVEAALAERLSRRTGIPVAPPGPVPLSPVQRSLWLMASFAPGEPVAARPLHLRLDGPLDASALERSLTALVDRHTILRSVFPLIDGEPMQVVRPPEAVHMEHIDLCDQPDPARAALGAVRAHGETVFDLATEIPFRPQLFELSPTSHVLSVAMHHIVFDGWSEQRFIDEIARLYDAEVDGDDPGLPELPVQVRDVAAWQAGRLDEAKVGQQLAWWTERLSGLPPDLALPVDRPPFDDGPIGPVEVDLGRELTDRIRSLAKAHDATLFMVLLAGVQALIHRLTGMTDVVVGVPSAGRRRPETEGLIGCFIDTMAVRTQVDPTAGFGQLLAGTRTDTLEALARTDVSFARVLGAIRPWTGGDRTPLYRVNVQMRNFPIDRRASRHLDVDVWGPRVAAGAHLSVRGEESEGSLRISLTHDPARFHVSTIRRWAKALCLMLESATTVPGLSLGDIDIIDHDERLLVEGGWDGPEPWSQPPTLAGELLREAARRDPGAIALDTGEQTITYREFDRLADRGAGELQRRGIGPGDAVVLFLDRHPDTAVAIFSALRAGVAYVPVDAELTAQWLRTVIDQVGPKLIVTRPHLAPQLEPLGVSVTTVDQLVAGASAQASVTPSAGDLAYILYTSGSTGTPKGVMVEQGNLAAFLAAAQEKHPFGPGDRVPWFHTISFDAVAGNLHGPLTAGATVVLRDEHATTSIPRFLAWCDSKAITHLRLPTSFGHLLLELAVASNLDLPTSLRFISFGGEQARADIIEQWRARFGDRVKVWNTYGPTETTVWVTTSEVTALPLPIERVPIGWASRGVKVRIRDVRDRPVPIGVVGEVHLGGPLVARGYLGAPDATAAFATDRDGVRWYRTGDLGRWLADGQIELFGRSDRQVKIRGFRVEPAEIEHALRAVPGVTDAVTVTGEGPDGEPAIHAYIVGEASVDAIREVLRSTLAPFMLPAAITVVSDLPLTISGKLDIARLSAPRPDVRPAVDDVLDTITAILAEVLQLGHVDPTDGFFELGGHSLLAIRVVSRIKERLSADLPLTTLFSHPTAAELAEVVRGMRDEPASSAAPATSERDLDSLLAEIEDMTDEEAAALLAALDVGEGRQ